MSEVDPSVAETTCPVCGKQTPNLNQVDSGLRLTLQKTGQEVPEIACLDCLKSMKKSASAGTQLIAKEEALSERKQSLWENRIKLIKQGRMMMGRKDYAEAAICYEKYLKILELVIGSDRENLDPQQFSDRPKEITIICSVLWDLMLIYDASPKYSSKQLKVATTLAKFLRFTPIYSSVIRKAEKEMRVAKNAANYRHLLKMLNVNATRCFIATSAFESGLHPSVQKLCAFRDYHLKQYSWGRRFILFYYKSSPKFAGLLDCYPKAKPPIRFVLRGVASLLNHIFHLPDRPVS